LYTIYSGCLSSIPEMEYDLFATDYFKLFYEQYTTFYKVWYLTHSASLNKEQGNSVLCYTNYNHTYMY
jgi:hypothetical protein